jgi:lysophospholipase L1-like esterase
MSTVRPAPAVDETCRQVLRTTVSADRVRVRLSNVMSTTPLMLSAVTVGIRTAGAAVRDVRPLTVGGRNGATVPAATSVTTDPVDLRVRDGDDVAVSFAIRGTATLSAHLVGAATGWCTGPRTGDHTRDLDAKAFGTVSRLGLVLESVDVPGGRGVLAVGDSLTDPPLPPDTYERWTDLVAAGTGRPVANVGIGGNRVVLPGGYGSTLVERFDRDVLQRPGATTLVLFAGTNDVSVGISRDELTARLQALCVKAKQRGLRIVLVTLAPAHKRAATLETTRQQVNAWIRTTPDADAVVDADALLRDPANPRRLRSSYDLGDGLHLSAEGHRAVGTAVLASI